MSVDRQGLGLAVGAWTFTERVSGLRAVADVRHQVLCRVNRQAILRPTCVHPPVVVTFRKASLSDTVHDWAPVFSFQFTSPKRFPCTAGFDVRPRSQIQVEELPRTPPSSPAPSNQ